VTCDGRLFHRRAAATGNALSPTVDRRVRRASRDVDEAKRIVVVWLQCMLVDVVVALVERWTRDRKVAGSTPGRVAVKLTRSTQPSIPPG